MFPFPERKRPTDIHFSTELTIDRKLEGYNPDVEPAFICLGLEGVLFKKVEYTNRYTVPELWQENLIEVKYQSNGVNQKCLLLERPGAGDFLCLLAKHALYFIYTSQEIEFAEEALLQLSIAQGHPDTCSEIEYDRGEAYMDLGIWARKQCMKKNGQYMKSLGEVSYYFDSLIKDIWLVDNKPELLDFPSHGIYIPEFTGDPEDRELSKLADRIFVDL